MVSSSADKTPLQLADCRELALGVHTVGRMLTFATVLRSETSGSGSVKRNRSMQRGQGVPCRYLMPNSMYHRRCWIHGSKVAYGDAYQEGLYCIRYESSGLACENLGEPWGTTA